MKKFLSLVVLSLLSILNVSVYANTGKGHVIAHTFFSVRPQYQSASPEKESFFRHDVMDIENCRIGGALEIVPFGGSSFQGGSLAEFFLPFGRSCLNVKEFNPNSGTNQDGDPLKDVEARNFNIETVNHDFVSRICFCPKQTVFGLGITYKQALTRKCDGTVGLWFEASMPIERIQNTMGLTEKIINDGGGAIDEIGLDDSPRVGNMVQAFKQHNWKYGKIIKGCNLVKWGVADLELKIGYNTIDCGTCHLNSYAGILVPTGNKPKAHFVFEPIVGNNHHFGLMLGNNYGFELLNRGNHKLWLEVDNNSRFLFHNHQTRSFDLMDEQWGRYLETYANKEQALDASNTSNENSGTSGINLFTGCFKVSPRFSFDNNAAMVYHHCNGFIGEAGYNFYARQAEDLCLKNWPAEAQIKNINGLGDTNIARTIKDNFPDSAIGVADYAPILKNDINLDTAGHPAIVVNTIYATMGYDFKVNFDRPGLIAIGGSYEFCSVNTALQRWLVWFKGTVSF